MVRALLAAALLASAVSAQADVFNMGGTMSGGTWTGLASLSFVTVGNPGNAADPATGYGSVGYTYQMGEYDVTVGQYCQFLNSVATKSDPYGLYYSGMATDMPTLGIKQSGSPGNYSYSVIGSYSQGVNCPIFDVTWGDAARFCNWLSNGQPTSGTEGNGTTETGAYALDGDDAVLQETRNTGASYFLPSENEWYKAAYYDPSSGSYWAFPTQSNTMPSNVLSPTGKNNANYFNEGDTDSTNLLTPVGSMILSPGPYGTYDMGGDVWQWNEAIISGSYRGVRGGAYLLGSFRMASSYRDSDNPTDENFDEGFRVAASEPTPEPSSIALLLTGTVALGIWRQRRNAYGWRRRVARRTGQPELQDPPILSFPSPSSPAHAARRAA